MAIDLTKWKLRDSQLTAEYSRATARVKEEEVELERLRKKELISTEARVIIQHVAQEVQQKAHDKLQTLVSHCLKAVFDEPYSFKIHFERKRGRTEARLVFMRDGEEYEPMLASGGGCVDVAAFALRIACVMLTKPALRRLIILDEPFRFVHGADNRYRLRELLETLPGELGIQIVMSTGNAWLDCGKVIEVK